MLRGENAIHSVLELNRLVIACSVLCDGFLGLVTTVLFSKADSCHTPSSI